jgi:hypothetical protein
MSLPLTRGIGTQGNVLDDHPPDAQTVGTRRGHMEGAEFDEAVEDIESSGDLGDEGSGED